MLAENRVSESACEYEKKQEKTRKDDMKSKVYDATGGVEKTKLACGKQLSY